MEAKDNFTSRLSTGQSVAALVYIPVHLVLLPMLLGVLMLKGFMDEAELNLIYYAIGTVYMFLFLWKFFRRDFDALCDRPLSCIVEVCVSYGIMWGCNLLVNGTLLLLGLAENPNNEAIFDMAGLKFGEIAAMSVFLAPLVEEPMFRAGVFGVLRRYNRTLAYVVSILLFSAYHIWAYAVMDVKNLIYIVQYIPVSFLLCRCYERTNTIWSSIFMHMLVNGVSMALVYAMM